MLLQPDVVVKVRESLRWLDDRVPEVAARVRRLQLMPDAGVFLLQPRTTGQLLVNSEALRSVPVTVLAAALARAVLFACEPHELTSDRHRREDRHLEALWRELAADAPNR